MTILPRQSDNYEELKNRKLIQCELNIKVNTGLQKHSLRQTCIGCKLWRRRTRARRRQCSDRKGDAAARAARGGGAGWRAEYGHRWPARDRGLHLTSRWTMSRKMAEQFSHIFQSATFRMWPATESGAVASAVTMLRFFQPISSSISLKLAVKYTKVEDVIGTRSRTAA